MITFECENCGEVIKTFDEPEHYNGMEVCDDCYVNLMEMDEAEEIEDEDIVEDLE